MIRFILILMIAGIPLSCNRKEVVKEEPLARVFDKYLYPGNLKDIIPANISHSDSSILANDYIDKWIRKQLLLRRAEMNLTDEEKNVDKQLENYRTSLLIFKYEQSLIKQKLDTIISMEEVEKYYTDNPANFVLNENIVKAVYLKVPRDAPDLWSLRRWYRSEKDDDLKKLEAYAFQYAEDYNYFNDDWVDFSEIEKNLPVKIDRPGSFLKYRKYYEVKDSTYYYFLDIKDYRLLGTVAPLNYVMQDIRTIIMNKRKIQLVNRLESNIYNDALNRGYFTIY
ncbi:MAG: peptidyl-prolyl cis-trans isomerase [Bacteroidales bacterium]|nr:peptidyl-prolyl cis-trans isomerase [Bacteroidales bacterium]